MSRRAPGPARPWARAAALITPLAALLAAVTAPAQANTGAAQAAGLAASAAPQRRSGLADMSPALQALQRDDTQNPGLLAVQDGQALWATAAGAAQKSCASCHGESPRSLAGVAARYPAWDSASSRALNLGGRVNACRVRHQQATPWAVDSSELLAVTALIGLQSRGQPIAPPGDARLAPLRAQGQAIWQQRQGQLNLACAQCHDQRAGQRLGGALIPQGHPSGYPAYRLEWQALGSLQRRLQGCLVGVRAEPYAVDATEWLALEAYLAVRAAGMAVETPAVRP